MGKETRKIIANNKKAWHDYFIEEKYEAGIELVGTEVKPSDRGIAALRRHLSGLTKIMKCRFTVCISIRTKKEISLTKIRCV